MTSDVAISVISGETARVDIVELGSFPASVSNETVVCCFGVWFTDFEVSISITLGEMIVVSTLAVASVSGFMVHEVVVSG